MLATKVMGYPDNEQVYCMSIHFQYTILNFARLFFRSPNSTLAASPESLACSTQTALGGSNEYTIPAPTLRAAQRAFRVGCTLRWAACLFTNTSYRSSNALSARRSFCISSASRANAASSISGCRNRTSMTSLPSPFGITRMGT